MHSKFNLLPLCYQIERNMKTKQKFYQFDQNNSGGFFDVNDKICHRVLIESDTLENALDKFYPMIKDQSYSCHCCGDRWSPEYAEEIDYSNFNSVEDYCQYLSNDWGWTTPDIRIYFLDGTVKEIFKQN